PGSFPYFSVVSVMTEISEKTKALSRGRPWPRSAPLTKPEIRKCDLPGRLFEPGRLFDSPGHAIAMQIGAVGVEPCFGEFDVGVDRPHQAPEARRVIELEQVRDLMRGEIVEHEGRRQNEPPGKRERAAVGARAPAARLVAHADALDGDAEHMGVASGC